MNHRKTNWLRKYEMVFAIGLSLIAYHLPAQINSDSLISVYSAKMQKYLDKENKLSDVFSFTKDGIEVYQPATDTSGKKFEFILYWNELGQFVTMTLCPSFDELGVFSSKKTNYWIISPDNVVCGNDGRFPIRRAESLEHCRICLDPGHIGGDLETAKKEKKWVEMKNSPTQLIEGNLTLATAKILKKKLEAEGAMVMLTRDKEGISSFGITYEKLKDSLFLRSLDSAYVRGDISFEEKNFLLYKANDTEIFRRFFLQEDLRERARKINEFHPDLTLVIHYNVDETNKEWNKPTKKDYNMAFVGGSFAADELDKPESRIDFLRLLLTDDIENSISFSKFMVEGLVKETKVPAAMDSCAIYLKGNCITTNAQGVFCRNLALTRMVRGTICYGESLYQDNVNEYKLLSEKNSKRVEEVAEGYFLGIMNYIKSKNQK